MTRIVKPAKKEYTVTAEPIESVPVLPADGEEVLFNEGERWVLAEVVGREENGDLQLLCDMGDELVSQKAVHSTDLHGWLTYDEAAQLLTKS